MRLDSSINAAWNWIVRMPRNRLCTRKHITGLLFPINYIVASFTECRTTTISNIILYCILFIINIIIILCSGDIIFCAFPRREIVDISF